MAAALQGYRIAPRPCRLRWDYGPEESYPAFVVAEFSESGTGIAYSEYGFGPSVPWILIDLEAMAFGMDSESFLRIEDAFRSSCAWTEPPPPGYEVQ